MTKLWQHKDVRVFVWTVFNAGITLVISFLSGLEGEQAVLVSALGIPFLNIITKFINTRYFNDLGVQK